MPGFVRQPADPREKANLLPKRKRPQIPGRSAADPIALTRPRWPPVGDLRLVRVAADGHNFRTAIVMCRSAPVATRPGPPPAKAVTTRNTRLTGIEIRPRLQQGLQMPRPYQKCAFGIGRAQRRIIPGKFSLVAFADHLTPPRSTGL